MAVDLAEGKKIVPDKHEMLFSTIGEATPYLSNSMYEFLAEYGYRFVKESTLPTVGTRAINDNVSASNGTNSEVTVNLKYLQGIVSLDMVHPASTQNDQIGKQVRALGLYLNYLCFKGDSGVTATEFDGLEVTATQTVDAGTGALSLTYLDEAITKTRGGRKAIYMNQSMYIRFMAAARSQTVSGNINYLPNQMGIFTPSYNGVPIYQAGETSAGDQVLSFSEGAGTNETSIYVVSHEGVMLLNREEPFTILNVPATNGRTVSINYLAAQAQRETKGVTRIYGITDAAITA